MALLETENRRLHAEGRFQTESLAEQLRGQRGESRRLRAELDSVCEGEARLAEAVEQRDAEIRELKGRLGRSRRKHKAETEQLRIKTCQELYIAQQAR